MTALLNIRAADGSRQFFAQPQTASWYEVRDFVRELPGAKLTGFLTDDVTEAWIDFTFAGHSFTINDQFGEYWFFVADPSCPDAVLDSVAQHFARLS